jgi:hypothetical protein
MIHLAHKAPIRDPQAGVSFRPSMLVHAGSLHEVPPHRLEPLEETERAGHAGLLPWTLVMVGLMAAFFLGTSWSTAPRTGVGDTCPAAALDPAQRAEAQRPLH